jgi:hypothetical protein
MLANASIQNTTTLQGLPLFIAFIDFPAWVAATAASRFRGDGHVLAWSVEMQRLFRGVA